MWNPLHPLALSHPQLNTRWVSVTTKAQSELCATLAEDCSSRVSQSEVTIKSLLIELSQIIDHRDVDEINSKLQSPYIVDKLYTQKILARNNTKSSKARPSAKEPRIGSAKRRAPHLNKHTRHSIRDRGTRQTTIQAQR